MDSISGIQTSSSSSSSSSFEAAAAGGVGAVGVSGSDCSGLTRRSMVWLSSHGALRPQTSSTKYGFKAKPPSMKTTWLIIYVILGFLALMSLLFFLRWYGGKGK